MSRTYSDEAVAEARRLIREANGRRAELLRKGEEDYCRVRWSCRGQIVTVTVEGFTESKDKIVWFGRGRSLFEAMAWLGAWEAF